MSTVTTQTFQNPGDELKPLPGVDVETALHLQSNLHRLYTERRHTDVTVCIKDVVFECHKAVLAATSPYFDAMFSSGMKESVDNIVRPQGLSTNAFENILTFLYTGRCEVDVDNAEEILKASSMFQITMLTEKCEKFLIGHICSDNCLALWKIARAHVCKLLEEKSYACILSNFQEISKSENFYCLDKEELQQIISNDDLNVPQEESVCDAVFSWCKADAGERSRCMDDLIPHLRLPLVTSEYLINEVESHPILKENRRCQRVVSEAVSYHMLPARRHEFTSPRTFHRHHTHSEEVLVVLGGYSDSGEKVTDVLCYSNRKKKWFILCPLLFKLGREYCCTVYGNDIFVSGGSQKPQSLVRFNSEHNEWHKCTQMITGRRRHIMVAVGESLYVMGGYDDRANEESKRTLCDVEEFQLSTCTWRKSGCLVQAVRSMSAAVSKEKIFVFGGLQNDERETSAIQCFDTRFQSTYFIGDLCLPCKLTRSVFYDKRIYIFCTDGTVMDYDDDYRCKIVSKIPNFNRRRFGAVRCRGGVVIVGGESGDAILRDTVWFDPSLLDTDTSAAISFTLPGRANFGVANIVIKKKFLNVEWAEEL
ncbi:kelch-like protein 24 [Haliotis rubra]|uniref:kelch-like protein 24 n=1 Tax=Haliotis rubra TaxID=36100 RepID=UPI001EE5A8F4|nr:kelch-like protein 24 [Haliotis rubra]